MANGNFSNGNPFPSSKQWPFKSIFTIIDWNLNIQLSSTEKGSFAISKNFDTDKEEND